MELKMAISYYPWAKRGKDSLVGRLSCANAGCKFEIDQNTPYGILWIGTHSNGRSTLKGTLQDLGKYLKENTRLLGIPGALDLPFVLRVLSVKYNMAVKCHPDKEQSRFLHKLCPLRYPDRISKDLTILSLGYCHLLVGLRPHDEIRYFLKVVPELSLVIPCDKVVSFIKTETTSIKELLYELFSSPFPIRKLATECFFSRMESSDKCVRSTQYYDLIKSMHALNAYDPGIFSPFLFNHVIMPPGTGLYIPLRVTYTFLSGDFIECASRSVNALKIGLSRLTLDVDMFMKMADLDSHDPQKFMLPGSPIDLCTTTFKSPVQESAVDRVSVPEGVSYTLPTHISSSMFLITRGYIQSCDFRRFRKGAALFLPSNYVFEFKAKEDTTLYQIYNFL